MKKIICLFVTAFLLSVVFAEDGYKCTPTYEVYRDTCYYQMTNGKYITKDGDAILKKGTEISGQTSYWYLKDNKAPNRLSPYIDPYDLKIKDSDVFEDYVLSSFDGNYLNFTESEKSTGKGTHLHLSVYITDKSKEIANKDTIKMSDSVDKIISNQSKTDFNYLTHSNSVFKIVNPFNYGESRS